MAAFAAPALSLSFTIAMGTMAATGVASALFTYFFKPGVSPSDGPGLMAKGYVAQALMLGLALAMTSPWLFGGFALLGMFGFGLVLRTTARELWSHRPGAPVVPPVKTARKV